MRFDGRGGWHAPRAQPDRPRVLQRHAVHAFRARRGRARCTRPDSPRAGVRTAISPGWRQMSLYYPRRGRDHAKLWSLPSYEDTAGHSLTTLVAGYVTRLAAGSNLTLTSHSLPVLSTSLAVHVLLPATSLKIALYVLGTPATSTSSTSISTSALNLTACSMLLPLGALKLISIILVRLASLTAPPPTAASSPASTPPYIVCWPIIKPLSAPPSEQSAHSALRSVLRGRPR